MIERETALFFPNAGRNLYGIVTRPADGTSPNASFGVVICEAFAEEKLFAQRVMANFARTLGEGSFWVLRFDCMGNGDSEGSFEESNISTRLSDIAAAFRLLEDQSRARHIGLFGLRLGGTLAAMAAEKDSEVAFVIACQPVVSGERYFYECLRSNLSMQMAMHGKVLVNRDELIRKLETGEEVNIDGYHVSPQLYREIASVNLCETARSLKTPLLVMQVAKSESAPLDRELEMVRASLDGNTPLNEFVSVREEAFWKDIPLYYTRAENVGAISLKWLNRLVCRRA